MPRNDLRKVQGLRIDQMLHQFLDASQSVEIFRCVRGTEEAARRQRQAEITPVGVPGSNKKLFPLNNWSVETPSMALLGTTNTENVTF